ncbi:hypothetical protein GGR54DRAFT_585070 [Hypoxylon sp. NC1633]|nr:hypothetical protein GGR54DRAFT_585070 [Hypoxylon sp. NC1633]
MATPIPVCRECSRTITLFYHSSLRPLRSSHRSYLRISNRSFATVTGNAKAKPGLQNQKPKAVPQPSKAVAASLAKSTHAPHLSYAQQLADKSSPTTLYEAGPNKIFLFSSYMAGVLLFTGAGVNIWLHVVNAPDDIQWFVPLGFGTCGVLMAAIGTRFALMPAGAIRSIKLLPSRSVDPAARTAQPASVPVRLEIEVRRNVPLPGLPLRRFQIDPNDVVLKVPMYHRKVVPSDYQKMLLKEQEDARRKAEREYELNHVMTSPFRHAAKAFGIMFRGIRRGLTGEGFAPVEVNGVKYKLDITSAYALEEGRALDRIVRIETGPINRPRIP